MYIVASVLFISASKPSLGCDAAPTFIHEEKSAEYAYWDESSNEIHLSKKYLDKHSYDTQQFILAHECGHASGQLSETGADIYAFRYTKGNLNEQIVNEICESLGQPNEYRCVLIKDMLKRRKN